jgi:hypothetical protein
MRRTLVAIGACLVATIAACSSSDAASGDDAGATPPAPPADPPPAPPTPPGPPSSDASTDGDGSTALTTYDHDGTGTYTTASANVTNGASSFTLSLFVPDAPGPHPVVSLSPGLLQPASAYVPFAKRLASWGIVVVMRDDPGPLTNTASVEADIGYVVSTWLADENVKKSSPLGDKVDLAHVGLAGHSRGGKASLLAAENEAKGKVKAWFGLDPVDSTIPGDNTHARDSLATVGIPIGMIGAEVASSCSPAADTFAAYYAAAVTPVVLVKALGAGHTQLEDPAACNACGLCSPAGTADGDVVLAYSVRYLTAFFARELLGDASVGAAFAGAGAAADTAAGRVTISAK